MGRNEERPERGVFNDGLAEAVSASATIHEASSSIKCRHFSNVESSGIDSFDIKPYHPIKWYLMGWMMGVIDAKKDL